MQVRPALARDRSPSKSIVILYVLDHLECVKRRELSATGERGYVALKIARRYCVRSLAITGSILSIAEYDFDFVTPGLSRVLRRNQPPARRPECSLRATHKLLASVMDGLRKGYLGGDFCGVDFTHSSKNNRIFDSSYESSTCLFCWR